MGDRTAGDSWGKAGEARPGRPGGPGKDADSRCSYRGRGAWAAEGGTRKLSPAERVAQLAWAPSMWAGGL